MQPLELALHGFGLEALDEIGGVDVEALGDLEEVVEREVALAALDLAEERPVEIAARRGPFEGEAKFGAAGADSLTEDFGGLRAGLGHHPRRSMP
jgi:hypothetical protein